MTLARAETSWKEIHQIITITANIADGIEWGPKLAGGLDLGLEV